jgi:hypothetical protein
VEGEPFPVTDFFRLSMSKNCSALEEDADSGGAAIQTACLIAGGDHKQRG